MKMLATNTYRMKNATRNNILSFGFHYYAPNDDDTKNLYIYTFPVYKHNHKSVTDCELVVEEQTGRIIINVYHKGTKNPCQPFYNLDSECYAQKYKSIMDKNVEKEFVRLGIEEL